MERSVIRGRSCPGEVDRRVGEDVATLTPHRPGRADFPHPVLRGRASLTCGANDHSYRSFVTLSHSLCGELSRLHASTAIHCRVVYRLAGCMSLSVFPVNGSLRAAPPFPPAGSRRARFPRSRRYYEGATTSHPRVHGRLFVSLPLPTGTSWFVLAAALPEGRRTSSGPGRLVIRPPKLPALNTWTRMGSLRSSGDPSCASAPFQDPGRADAPLPVADTSMLPPLSGRRRPRRWLISGLTPAALAPTDLRFAFCVATHAQGSFPAGWLTFAGRASNPLDRCERFQFV